VPSHGGDNVEFLERVGEMLGVFATSVLDSESKTIGWVVWVKRPGECFA
jgi:hypothetical protein